jgi:hypothetical protein
MPQRYAVGKDAVCKEPSATTRNWATIEKINALLASPA